jgi:Tol biopolymer transport system component
VLWTRNRSLRWSLVGSASWLSIACHDGKVSLGLGPDETGTAGTGGAMGSGATGSGATGSGAEANAGGTPGSGEAGEGGSAAAAGGSTPTGGSAPTGGTGPTVIVPAIGTLTRVSNASDGTPASGSSTMPTQGKNGRLIAFESSASALVTGDTNGTSDVFVHDRSTGQTIRVSLNEEAEQLNGPSWLPSLSQDGQWIAFSSAATNIGEAAVEELSVAYLLGPIGELNAFVPRLATSTPVSAIGSSLYPALSSNGEVGAYLYDDGISNVFAFRRAGGAPALMSDCGGSAVDAGKPPRVSGDGRLTVFHGGLLGLQRVFATNLANAECRVLSVTPDGSPTNGNSSLPSVSDDGRLVAFVSEATNLTAGDDNGVQDIFVRDLQSETTLRFELGTSYEPALSGDGRFLAFVSADFDAALGGVYPYGLYVRNLATGRTAKVLERNGTSNFPFFQLSLSSDGSVLVFASFFADLTDDDVYGSNTDIFVFEFSEQP